MKLSIGINIFKENKRQTLAIEVLKQIAKKYTNVTIFDINFEHSEPTEGITHMPVLTRTSSDVTGNSLVRKPISKDLFTALSNTDCDYFLFLNSDIFLTEKCLTQILKGDYESYIFSRIDIHDIDSLEEELKPMRMEIAGFDAWAVKKSWWLENSEKFPDYIYGESLWDIHYALTLYYNSKCYLGNKGYYIAHIKHPLQWTENSPEHNYNAAFWTKTDFHEIWHYYVYNILINRQPRGMFLQPLPNEEELEQRYLNLKQA